MASTNRPAAALEKLQEADSALGDLVVVAEVYQTFVDAVQPDKPIPRLTEEEVAALTIKRAVLARLPLQPLSDLPVLRHGRTRRRQIDAGTRARDRSRACESAEGLRAGDAAASAARQGPRLPPSN